MQQLHHAVFDNDHPIALTMPEVCGTPINELLWVKYPSGLNSVAGQRTRSCDVGVIPKSKVNINDGVYVQ